MPCFVVGPMCRTLQQAPWAFAGLSRNLPHNTPANVAVCAIPISGASKVLRVSLSTREWGLQICFTKKILFRRLHHGSFVGTVIWPSTVQSFHARLINSNNMRVRCVQQHLFWGGVQGQPIANLPFGRVPHFETYRRVTSTRSHARGW